MKSARLNRLFHPKSRDGFDACGRTLIQHPTPAAITRALMMWVRDGATATEAARFLA